MNLFGLTSWIPTDMNISRVRMKMRRTGHREICWTVFRTISTSCNNNSSYQDPATTFRNVSTPTRPYPAFRDPGQRQNFDKYVSPYILRLLLIRAGTEQNPGPSYICPICQTNLDAAKRHCVPPATAGFIFSVVDSRT